jgi:PiT family inorganic phosphate transporter
VTIGEASAMWGEWGVRAGVGWGVAGRMATAWIFTLLAAAFAGAACALANAIGTTAGVVVGPILTLASGRLGGPRTAG